MNTIRIAHSAWTKPMLSNRWDILNQLENNLWFYALSLYYAKSLGLTVVLHTDDLGSSIYGELPYDAVYKTLETNQSHSRIWASGKILAQQHEPLHSVHIDGDVFLKSTLLRDILNKQSSDLVVQEIENLNPVINTPLYSNLTSKLIPILHDLPKEWDYTYNQSINCGLVQFNNQVIKDRYINEYWNLCEQIMNNSDYISILDNDNNIISDLIIEQYLLFCISKNYNVEAILNNNIQEEAIRLGYTHVLGKSKYDKIEQVKERLKQLSPILYSRVLDIIKNNI